MRPGRQCSLPWSEGLPLSPPFWSQTLQNEVRGHAPRVEDVLRRGKQLVVAAETGLQDIEERLGHLQASWDTLQEAAVGRGQRLRDAHEAQQYYLDADEAEAWISEQELYIFSDEPPKVCWGARVGRWGRARVCSEPRGLSAVPRCPPP